MTSSQVEEGRPGECVHEIFPAASCTLCNPKQEGAARSTKPGYFTAKFPGTCAECKGAIEVGDVISRSDRDAGYRCEDCSSEPSYWEQFKFR